MLQAVDSAVVRAYMLESIAVARVNPFFFPACYLRLEIESADQSGVRLLMPHGLHNTDPDGTINVGAIAVLADIALSVAMRQSVGHETRLATVALTLNFNGEPVDGDVAISAHYLGPAIKLQTNQGSSIGELRVGKRLVGHVSGTFASPPLPPGTSLQQLRVGKRVEPERDLRVGALTEQERSAYDRALLAVRAVNSVRNKTRQSPRSFIQEFWGQGARKTGPGRARSVVTHGPHIHNRIGHLQGGVMFGAAVACAQALVAADFRLVSATAWYLKPGVGKLSINACFLQDGKSIAVLRTEVRNAQGARVFEMVSTYGCISGASL